MKLPNSEEEVLVKLDNGKFAVAEYFEGHWYTGKGVVPSHECESDSLSGKVVSWTKLPPVMENDLEEVTKTKPKMK